MVEGFVLHDCIVSCPDVHHHEFLQPFVDHQLLRPDELSIYGGVDGYWALSDLFARRLTLDELVELLPITIPTGHVVARAIQETEVDLRDPDVLQMWERVAAPILNHVEHSRQNLGAAYSSPPIEFFSGYLFTERQHIHQPTLEAEAELDHDSALIHSETFRTNLYLGFCQELGIPYSPSAVRAPLVLLKARRNRRRFKSFAKVVVGEIEAKRSSLASTLNTLFDTNAFEYSTPPLLQLYLFELQKSGSPFAAVMALRNDRYAASFRKWVRRINVAAVQGDSATANKAVQQLRETCFQWTASSDAILHSGEFVPQVIDLVSGKYISAAKGIASRILQKAVELASRRHLLYIRRIQEQLEKIGHKE